MRTATAILVVALAGAGAFGLAHGWGERDAVLLLPTTLGGLVPTEGAGSVAAPLPGVTVAPSALSFGPLRPSKDGAPIEVRVHNAGAVPVQVRLAASPLVEPTTGASIPADAIQVVPGPAGNVPIAPLATVPPGGASSLWVRLAMPSGAVQWLPAGAYAGSVTLHVQEVDA